LRDYQRRSPIANETLGYEVVSTMSQKRDELDGATVLGKGRLEELAAITGGT
jgi:GTP-binding protein HflX